MNCFSKTQFSLLFHPIFLSFACFGMFHFRNSKFLNETGTSNKTSNFPNILFQFCFFCFALGVPGGLCFCVSEGCEPGSSNATILGMPGSIPMIKQNIQHPKQKNIPTVKSNYFRVACSAFTLEILVFQAEFWVIFSRSVHCCFRGFDEVWSPDFRSTKAQERDDSIPKMACSTVNHMVISVLSS